MAQDVFLQEDDRRFRITCDREAKDANAIWVGGDPGFFEFRKRNFTQNAETVGLFFQIIGTSGV